MAKSQPRTHCSEDRKRELIPEALGILGVRKDKEIAAEWIEDLAKAFRSRFDSFGDSPTFKDLRHQLEDIRDRAIELERLLVKTWPNAHAAAAAYCSFDDWQEHTKETWPYARAVREGEDAAKGIDDAIETADDTDWKYSDSPDDWREHARPQFYDKVIKAPVQARAALQKVADAATTILERLPAQKGGERNLEARFHGLAKQWLAVECWALFDRFRPGEATSTEGGNYHGLVNAVYELATGQRPEDGVGLERYVKRTPQFCRDLLDRNPKIEALLHRLEPDDSPVGILSETMAVREFYDIPQRLLDDFQHGRPHEP